MNQNFSPFTKAVFFLSYPCSLPPFFELIQEHREQELLSATETPKVLPPTQTFKNIKCKRKGGGDDFLFLMWPLTESLAILGTDYILVLLSTLFPQTFASMAPSSLCSDPALSMTSTLTLLLKLAHLPQQFLGLLILLSRSNFSDHLLKYSIFFLVMFVVCYLSLPCRI